MDARPGWIQLFLDTPATDLDRAAAFWSAATGWRPSPRRGESDQFLTLLPSAGAAWVKLQAVDGPGGVHLDLDSTDRDAALARSRELGASDAWVYEGVPVMRSPGGLTFCHTLLADDGDDDGADGGDGPALARDGGTVLDQVCLDVPWALWDVEVDFWSRMTGRELQQGSSPEFARLLAPGAPRILLQRLGERDGAVRAHPDLATADRAGDLQLHLGLGARHEDERDHWSVLTAPGGQVYCLTDRDPATGSAG
ncbi:putative enzyme related to lactoylglutathione lyase [Nocardioides cavernae]|uniref:Putative enzyme related to lactoylglutathione lyase n=1 Tax=Nocardioides cavernae TaxID=1921566 RepID=A0A7Y9KSV7_9ACTN|nr:VOC family protein [Nocardioides cavernae]NYE37964.1 putative enzyme related to lactoylglutathione lyase [Nocardioides cavernae]